MKAIDRHCLAYAKELHWDLRGTKPRCDSLWVNVMPEGGSHTSHIHPNSVISGTYYVAVPQGAGPIVYEDPRLGFMMAAPPRKASLPRESKTHVPFKPETGTLMLWESWLRHEVPLNRAEGNRISVSFNYVWREGFYAFSRCATMGEGGRHATDEGLFPHALVDRALIRPSAPSPLCAGEGSLAALLENPVADLVDDLLALQDRVIGRRILVRKPVGTDESMFLGFPADGL